MSELNRRGFLATVAAAAVSAVIASRLPLSWMPLTALRRETALEYLRRAYREFANGNAARHPRRIEVGGDLYEAVVREMLMTERWLRCEHNPETNVRTVKFKAATLHAVGDGWEIKSIA